MKRPVLVCDADLTHAPEARDILESAFTVRYVERTTKALEEEFPEADAYYASIYVQITADLMDKASRLKAITTPSTGRDHIDLQAAAQREITVLSLKEDRELLDKITATAELAWTLVLALSRRLCSAVEAANKGHWARNLYRGHQLAYKTLGILGCGRLGTMVADYGRAFRMKVIGCDIRPVHLDGVQIVSFDELLRQADVLTVHIHLTEENTGLIDREALAKMKPQAIMVNTSRGAIIDEPALLEALQTGRLAGAGLDVIVGEWRSDLDQHPLVQYARSHENLIITPHIAGVTFESQAMAYAAAATKLADFFRNQK